MASPLALIFDLTARDGASPVFLRVAAAADAAAASTAKATAKMDASLAGLASAGSKLTKGITVPVVALGGLAAKAAVDFQSSMQLIQTQAGASADEVTKMSAAVLKLSGTVAQSPQALAKSLYLVESAGYRGAAALQVETAAAKLANVGHSDLTTTTDALVGLLQTKLVGGANDATKAVSQLNAIVGSGKLTMDDLVGALGTGVAASAKTFGVSLQSLGAALALMTDQGTPATQAATRLRMAMSLLAAPSKQAAAYLHDTGLSSADAGKQVSAMQLLLQKAGVTTTTLATDLRQPDGFLVALQDLKTHMSDAGLSAEESAALIARAFGGGRSAAPIEQMLANLNLLQQKYNAIGSGSGNFGKDVAANSQTAAYQVAQLRADVDKLAIQLGDDLLPVVKDVIKDISGAVTWFSNLSSGTQKTIVKVALFAAAVGPVLVILSKFIKTGILFVGWGKQVIGALTGVSAAADTTMVFLEATETAASGAELGGAAEGIGALGAAAATTVVPLVALTGGLLAAGYATSKWLDGSHNAFTLFTNMKSEVKALTSEIVANGGVITANTDEIVAAQLQSDGFAAKAAKAGISLTDLTTGVTGTTAQFQALVQTWKDSGDPSNATIVQLGLMREGFLQSGAAAQKTVAQQKAASAAAVQTAAAAKQAAAALAAQKAAAVAAGEAAYVGSSQYTKAVDALRALNPVEFKVLTAPAAKSLTGIQNQIKNLRQFTVPGVDVNTKVAVAKIAALEADLNGLAGLAAIVSGTAVSAPSANNGVAASGTGALGDLVTGGITSAAPIGTLGGRISQAAAQSRAQQAAAAAAAAKAAAGEAAGSSGGGGGSAASTLKSLQNALKSAAASLVKAASSSTSTYSTVLAAVKSLNTAAQALGLSSKALSKAVGKQEATLEKDAKSRDSLLAKLGTQTSDQNTAYDKLNTALTNFNNEASTVSTAIKSTFDLVSNGATAPAGGDAVDAAISQRLAISGTLNSLENSIAEAEQFNSAFAALSKKLGSSAAAQEIEQQLAEAGPGNDSELLALSGASNAQLKQLIAAQQKLDELAKAGGNAAAESIDGKQLKAAQELVTTLKAGVALLDKDIKNIGTDVANKLDTAARKAKSRATSTPTGKKT